jgi:hypothetical protein
MQGTKDRRMFMIRLCSDGAAYEAVPNRRLRVDMSALKRTLERSENWEVLLSTPQFMTIRRKDGIEVTVVDDGRMIIRNAKDQENASTIAQQLLPQSALKRD